MTIDRGDLPDPLDILRQMKAEADAMHVDGEDVPEPLLHLRTELEAIITRIETDQFVLQTAMPDGWDVPVGPYFMCGLCGAVIASNGLERHLSGHEAQRS